MRTDQVLDTFLEFYRDRGHRPIGGGTLIPPPGDPVLFTTSGVHRLIGYLEGEPHPSGSRLVNVQRCLRTTDLDEVGDPTHLTVFEMLGSWSLGDYDHAQSLRWGYELLTDGFGIPADRLHATVFGGDGTLVADTDALDTWERLGVPVEPLGGDDNWWAVGPTGPCGPDSEIFLWTGDGPPVGRPSVDPRWVELGNHVHMRYRRRPDGMLEPLPRPVIDTGSGLERLTALLSGHDSVFDIDLFTPWTEAVSGLWGLDRPASRLVCDHLRAAVTVTGEGVHPATTGRGYVLRRLVRRLLTALWRDDESRTLVDLPTGPVSSTLERIGGRDAGVVREVLLDEERRFRGQVRRGRHLLATRYRGRDLTDDDLRYLHETHGLPGELITMLRPERAVASGSTVRPDGDLSVR